MIGERKPHVEQRRVDRVSSAFWPLKTRKGVPTGKAAQRRRDWIMQGRWWIILVDALPMRVLLVLTTLLVVGASLLVALLGLRFWYLLLPPLLLFAALLIVPAFLVSRAPIEIPVPPLAEDMRSSAGFISQYAHELCSSAGFLSQYARDLRSSAGILSQHAHELRSEQGVLGGDGPATPMPVEPPLVRVLETYDVRATPMPGQPFLRQLPADTAEQAALRYTTRGFWGDTSPELLRGQNLPTSQVGPGPAPLDASCPGEVVENQDNRNLPPGV